MSPAELLDTVRQQPFEPFRLYLSDGTFHDVRHPEMLIVGLRSSYLALPSQARPEFVDHLIKLDNLHVTKTVPLVALTAATPS